MVVVDRGEGAAHVEDNLGTVDVVPVESEGFALARARADEELEQIGHRGIGMVAVDEEAGGLLRSPYQPLR
ncbi:hypothetical protein [Streptomyces sp. NPDC054961]